MTTASNSPRRHFFQFRLRTLLALMAAAGVLMAVCYHFLSNRKQWAAYEQVADKVQFSSTTPGRMVWLGPLAKRKSYWDITAISFRPSSQVKDDDLSHLAHMPRLKQLKLDKTSVTDGGLAHLALLTELTELSLQHTAVTTQGLARLHRLSNLKDLRLRGAKVTSAGLALLKNHPRLEHLELSGLPIRDQDLIHLASLSKLKHLDLAGTQITGGRLKHLAALKQLQHLKLHSARLGRVVLADMPNLMKVHIAGGPPLATVSLRRMNALNTLTLFKPDNGSGNLEVTVTDAPLLTELRFEMAPLQGLKLSNLPLLSTLDVARSNLRHVSLDNLPNVTWLRVNDAVFSRSLIQQASHLPDLTDVLLQNMHADEGQSQITAADLAFLRTAKHLKSVDLFGTKLAPKALSALRGHQQLESLVVCDCGLTDSSLADLATLPNLRRLDVRDNPISGSELRRLVDLPRLKQLQLNDTRLDDRGAK